LQMWCCWYTADPRARSSGVWSKTSTSFPNSEISRLLWAVRGLPISNICRG